MDDKEKRRKKQASMHRTALGRIEDAIENGYYFEAILQEYAALEGRLEVIFGILGMPCNKDAGENGVMINISKRRNCLKEFYKSCPELFKASKIPANFFEENNKLDKWLEARNDYEHKLLRDEALYEPRMKGAKKRAEEGYKYAKLLYNEASRLRRIYRNHSELLEAEARECKGNCDYIKNQRRK